MNLKKKLVLSVAYTIFLIILLKRFNIPTDTPLKTVSVFVACRGETTKTTALDPAKFHV